MLVVQLLERRPEQRCVMRQAVTRRDGLADIKPREAPVAGSREMGLVVAVQAGGHILHIANPEKRQFLNHQPRDDLRLARMLKRCLHRQEFLLADQVSVFT